MKWVCKYCANQNVVAVFINCDGIFRQTAQLISASGKKIPQHPPSGIFFPEEFPEADSCGILEFLHERTQYEKIFEPKILVPWDTFGVPGASISEEAR